MKRKVVRVMAVVIAEVSVEGSVTTEVLFEDDVWNSSWRNHYEAMLMLQQ
jgi:hypothetical protein